MLRQSAGRGTGAPPEEEQVGSLTAVALPAGAAAVLASAARSAFFQGKRALG